MAREMMPAVIEVRTTEVRSRAKPVPLLRRGDHIGLVRLRLVDQDHTAPPSSGIDTITTPVSR